MKIKITEGLNENGDVVFSRVEIVPEKLTFTERIVETP
jgi:hypothetical protein